MKKQSNAARKARISNAIVGFRIPMLSIPELYSALETGVAAGLTDADLRAIVAGFPGVETAGR